MPNAKIELNMEELDLVKALLVDRKVKSENLASNSASRTTRHARLYELGILDRIATKLGGWPSEVDDELVDDSDAPGLVCDETDLHEGKLADEPPAQPRKRAQ